MAALVAGIDSSTQACKVVVRDAESGARRTLWLSAGARERWHEGVARRRAELSQMFGKRAMQPFYIEGEFDPEAFEPDAVQSRHHPPEVKRLG